MNRAADSISGNSSLNAGARGDGVTDVFRKSPAVLTGLSRTILKIRSAFS